SDLNLNYPLDVTGKRRARTRSAIQALKVSEAQLQDAVRTQIDNLYTVYVNVISTGLTVTFSEKYEEGLRLLLNLVEGQYKAKTPQITEADGAGVRANLERAQIQVREARSAKITANQALALILNLSLADLEKLDVRDSIGQFHTLPMSSDELVQKALATRP